MEYILNSQIDEAEARRRWRKLFFAQYAPVYVRYALYAVMLFCIGIMLYNLRYFMFVMGAAYLLSILTWYPRTWKLYRETLRKLGAFEHPTTVHLTDSFLEVTCGENTVKNEYRVFSEYIELKHNIALLNQKSIAVSFSKNDFSDGGAEFMQCLEKSGVKRLEPWGFKRWKSAFLPVVLMALLGVVYIAQIANVQNRLWMYEKSCMTLCRSNLKQMMLGLFIYSDDMGKAGITSFPQSLPLDEMVAAGCVKESYGGCPKSCVGYIYVPYNRPLDYKAGTAANTPVLFDWMIGCHRYRKHLLWGKEMPQTIVAFEDGSVSIEENLASFMDIWKKYAPLMSKEDAEVLRKTCKYFDDLEQ